MYTQVCGILQIDMEERTFVQTLNMESTPSPFLVFLAYKECDCIPTYLVA